MHMHACPCTPMHGREHMITSSAAHERLRVNPLRSLGQNGIFKAPHRTDPCVMVSCLASHALPEHLLVGQLMDVQVRLEWAENCIIH